MQISERSGFPRAPSSEMANHQTQRESELRYSELNQHLNHILYKHKKRKMIRRPIIGASALGISSIQTPSKKLMRERSSPGTRRNSHAGNDGESHRMNRHKDSEFQNVYKSVERLGGIGASKSVLNLDRDRS